MRGDVTNQALLLTTLTPNDFVPTDHPIRAIKAIVDAALQELSPLFTEMYARVGRPSVPPEHLLKSCLLIALYSIRSERQFCERLHYDLLFKWFLGLNISDPAFEPPPSPRTRSGCWSMRWRGASSRPSWRRRSGEDFSRRTIALWMAHCWRRGPH